MSAFDLRAGVVDLRGLPYRLLYSKDPYQALDGEYALGRFQAIPAVREPGWEDPGPPASEPVDVTPPEPEPPPAAAEPCPMPRPCCDEMAECLSERNGVFQLLCNVPFCANRPTPPTVYACSDGGHGGMVEIRFCPFCGTQFSWRSQDGSSF